MQYTHRIISITATTTRFGDPMWRCATRDGSSVAIFPAHDGRFGTLHLFQDYRHDIEPLAEGECLRWTEHPIDVLLRQDGKYLTVVAVAPRPADTVPDVPFVPEPYLGPQAAWNWAQTVLASDAVIWDSETTGTDTLHDEIISMAAVRVDGTVLLNERIRPLHLGRNAASGAQAVNGITPDALRCAPPFEAVYPAIRDALQDKAWVIYNAAFDPPILERDCLRHGLTPLVSSGVTCAMTWYARFNEEWDPAYQSYRSKKLVEAAAALGVTVVDAHDALGDALMTLGVIQALAASVPF